MPFTDLPQGSSVLRVSPQQPSAAQTFGDLPTGAAAVVHVPAPAVPSQIDLGPPPQLSQGATGFPAVLQNLYRWGNGMQDTLVNALTFGGADEAVRAAGNAIGGATGDPGQGNRAADAIDLSRSEFSRQHPIAAAIGNVVGALPTMAIAPEAALSRISSVPLRVGAGGAIAGAEGAVAGLGNAQGSFSDRLPAAVQGAGIGLGLGLAAPLAGRALSQGARAAGAVRSMLSPSVAARNATLQALTDSGTTPQQMAALLAANPRQMPSDLDANLHQLLQGVSSRPGEARAIASQALETRRSQSLGAANGAYDAAMGATPDVQATLNQIRQTARTNAQQGFGQALAGIGSVDVGNVLDTLDQMSLPATINSKYRGLLTRANSTQPRLGGAGSQVQFVHDIQSMMGEDVRMLQGSATRSDLITARDLNRVRQNLIDEIDGLSGGGQGGAYRAAQRQYADDLAVKDAFDRGFDVLQNPTSGQAGQQARPEFFRSWVNNLTPDELSAAQLGARAAVDSAINSVRNATGKAESIVDVGFNRDRFAMLFGPQEADRLASTLSQERAMAAGYNDIMRGSQTAARTAGMAATEIPTTGLPLSAATLQSHYGLYALMHGQPIEAGAAMLGAGLTATGGVLRRQAALARNAELARLLTAQGPDAQRAMAAIGAKRQLPAPIPLLSGPPTTLESIFGGGARSAIPLLSDRKGP